MSGKMPSGEAEGIRSGSEVEEHLNSAAFRIAMRLIDLGDTHIFPEATQLLQQGQLPGRICLIEEGLVKLSCIDDIGREAIVGLRCQGWPLGITSVFSHSPNLFSAITLTRSHIRSVQMDHFRWLLTSDPQLLLAISELISQEIVRYVKQLLDLAFSPARQRLERILARLVTLMGQGCKTPSREFRIPIKQLELAQMIVVKPSYLSQLIGELEFEGIIARRRGWIVIPDPDRLKGLHPM